MKYLIVWGKQNGPLFLYPDGTKLTRPIFASALAAMLRKLNINPRHYNTHSFRIGAATSANQAGMSPLQIKALGRWRSEAYQRYIRLSPNQLASMTKSLISLAD